MLLVLLGKRDMVTWDGAEYCEERTILWQILLTEKFQNMEGLECMSTSNTNNLIYILETKFFSADYWVGAQ